MRILLSLSFILLISSCQEKKSKYVLDEKSEMAQLMLDMHASLDEVQLKIKNGENIGDYPEEFDKVIDAEMTDESMRSDSWESFANALIESERALYNAAPEEQEQAYKNVVNSCLACHTNVGCSGPIPKIKKLSWKP
ncbi:hypothetical protein NLM59_06295 [Weeksellaceae bacterium KMM 9724]|uniref:hypothetical protein n=1 Tax=Profundicola chukchiensis TaxID=2961959 RepID=UPI00243AFECF|nr:hypothetical protein [Profundicola chukchiensis]MDG4950526.1 hypothetical protein [Profundicola chukchiensis]